MPTAISGLGGVIAGPIAPPSPLNAGKGRTGSAAGTQPGQCGRGWWWFETFQQGVGGT